MTSGIALLCGVNRSGNKQLWITDSTTLAQNATSPCLRLMPQFIDCIATNGTTSLPISFGSSTSTTSINGSIITLIGGNVGIGLTNPATKLHIADTNTWQTCLEIDGSSTNKYSFNVGGTANTAIGTNAMGIYDGNAAINRFIMVFVGGNVGIGITNPSSALQVNGTLNATTIQENGTSLALKYLLQTTASTTYQSNLNASTSLLGIGSNLTLINYSNLSNIPVGLITSNSASNHQSN